MTQGDGAKLLTASERRRRSRASSQGRGRFPPELKKKPEEMRELGGEEKQR